MLPLVLAHQVRQSLLDYLRTTFRLRNPGLDQALFEFLRHPDRGIFRGPFVDVRLPFRRAESSDVAPLEVKPNFPPYAHQLRSWERLHTRTGHAPESTLVVTGTGSGKSECFMYPLLDHCRREYEQGRRDGIKAIILYPMNALASDQAERFASELWNNPLLKGKVSAGLYVGGTSDQPQQIDSPLRLIDHHDTLRQSPPDILLTNYRMLDFLLMRPADGKLWRKNLPETLQYLVLDELHTYDGAQGSDVACLIRRLRERLGTPPGHLCCIGTSATIGGGGTDARTLLCRFASDVFGTPFDESAIIGEDRKSIEETFTEEVERQDAPIPKLDSEGRDPFDPSLYRNASSYLDAQSELWLGHDARDPLAVAESLRRHDFLRVVLRAMTQGRGGPKSVDELVEAIPEEEEAFGKLGDRRPLALASFLSLVSHARIQDGERRIPFLQVQVQYWIRELRRLVRMVTDNGYHFDWHDELHGDDPSHCLPIVYCRDCGHDGLGAIEREGEARLLDDNARIGDAYLHKKRIARFVELGDAAIHEPPPPTHEGEQLELHKYLCRQCLRYSEGKESCGAQDCPSKSIPTLAHGKLSEKKRFLSDCPRCGGSDSLSMLGSRAASLSSVAISHLFSSPFNDDRKLLTFSDSVQDASHRAGFFSGRTFRFGIRTAIQSTLENAEGAIPLPELADRALEHWLVQLGPSKLISTFMPPDLREHPDYAKFSEVDPPKTPSKAVRDRAMRLLKTRLEWEVTREYGLGVVVGRSLENTGASTLSLPREALQEAGEALALVLNEERPAQFREPLTAQRVTHFLEGLLHRLRRRGGIHSPLLERYAKTGKKYLLSKTMEPRLSPMGRQLPRFWVLGANHQVFDPLYTKPTQASWVRDWTARALGCEMRDQGVNDVLRRAVHKLQALGILRAIDMGKEQATGLDPGALWATRDVGYVHCERCRTETLLDSDAVMRWTGKRCPVYRCTGTLAPSRADARLTGTDYYRRLYRSGRIERIFAEEHTGLLSRDDREDVERRFKAKGEERRADAPNLLSCTPTLEMGIDIGDLSTVMLCSVPPLASNYLQRVGRAGRKTGNALVLTMANAVPHDQYFYADPKEMMAGEVAPPGCFLDAPEMLMRQMAAYAMDRWAQSETDPLNQVPQRTQLVLGAAGEERFPGCFYRYYDEHHEAIAERFLALFAERTSPDTVAKLREFAAQQGPAKRIEAAFAGVRHDRDQLTKQLQALKHRQEQIEADPSLAEGESNDPQERLAEELEQLRDTQRSFVRLKRELANKYPLAVLTDAGALPNYAFPETGVTLKSILRGPGRGEDDDAKKKDPKKRRRGAKQASEYIRPASAALREFAPFNTFYAEGHKVKVTQIDLGTASQPLTESWRFCPSCPHTERIGLDASVEPECPRCGHSGWGDEGQKRTLVHFRKAMSVMNLMDATSGDSSEERESTGYRTHELVDIAPENVQGGWLVEDEHTTFGFDLLTGLTIREVNFGLRSTVGLTFNVSGNAVVQEGFVVCRHCGRVQSPFRKNKAEHAGYCKVRMGKAQEKFEDLYLYREMKSEALRLLLPVAESADLKEAIPSFRAALHLGLRKRFHGYPSHLRITSTNEPVDETGKARRRFLLIYDAVPGGTGYVADLSREGVLFDVMALALNAMRSCSCRSQGRDGCYRCVFAYQEQRDIGNISRTRAETLFGRILDLRHKARRVPTLSEVSIDRILESELEERFVQGLGRWVRDRKDWTWEANVVYDFGRCWRIVTPERTWRLEPQVPLGQSDGVMLQCRPDFVLRCTSDSTLRPVAIFCDGFRFHACPHQDQGRIADDIRKRQAILDSENFWVWTVTWKDVELDDDAPREEPPHLFSKLDARQRSTAKKHLAGKVISEVEKINCMEQLWTYLSQPDPALWKGAALSLGVGMLSLRPGFETSSIQKLRARLEQASKRFEGMLEPLAGGQPNLFAGHRYLDWTGVLLTIAPAALKSLKFGQIQFLLRLFDEREARDDPEFEDSWRAFFHAWNVLQFHESGTEVVSSEWLAEEATPSSEPAEERPTQPVSPTQKRRSTRETPRIEEPEEDVRLPAALVSLIDEFPEAEKLLRAVHRAGLPAPVDFEGLGDRRIEVESILAWPEYEVAIALEIGDDDARVWRRHGWRAFTPDDVETIVDAVKAAAQKGES